MDESSSRAIQPGERIHRGGSGAPGVPGVTWYSTIAGMLGYQKRAIIIASLIFSVVLTPLALIVFYFSGSAAGTSIVTYLSYGACFFLSVFVISFAGCMMGWD